MPHPPVPVPARPVCSPRRYWLALLLVLLLAMLPRLWLWFDHGRAGVVYPGDQDEYYRGAIHMLLDGSYYDDGQWLRPPALSIVLAGLFALLGRVDIPAALLLHSLISLGTLLLLAELARSMFRSQYAGIAAALLGAVFLPYASYASQLLSETLFIFFVCATLLAFEAARQRGVPWRWLLACGMLWALATLTRPISFFALPLALGLLVAGGVLHHIGRRLWARLTRRPATPAAPGGSALGLRRRMVGAAALLFGFVLVMSPWWVRNYAVHGHIILTDTSGGTSFWLGNLLEPDERTLQFVWNETIPNLAERQQVAMDRAIENIQREPLTFLTRTRNKAVSLWQFDSRLYIANAPIGITLEESSLAFAFASDVQYVLLMLLAAVGMVLARPWEQNIAVLCWPVYGTLLSAVSLGHPRLRLPLLVFAFVYAALPLAHPRMLWQRWRVAPRWQRAALYGAVVALLLLWYARVYPPFVQSQFWLLAGHVNRDPVATEQMIARGIAALPDNYLPYVALGDLRRTQGNLAGALAAYNRAGTLATQNTYTHVQRLDLGRRLGDAAVVEDAAAAIDAVSWHNNQLYTWAWHNLPPYLPLDTTRIPIEDSAVGVMRGVYPPQPDDDGRMFRWTYERAQIRLPHPDSPPPQTLTLTLRARQPAHPVTVWFGGERVATLAVGRAWQDYTIVLPPVASIQRDATLLEVQTRSYVQGPDDPYPRGVALRAVEWEAGEE